MKLKQFIIIVILLLVFIPLAIADKDVDQALARKLLDQKIILPLETLLEKAQQIHQGKLLEVELEQKNSNYIYEIEILDANGIVWEIYFNAASGELIKVIKDD